MDDSVLFITDTHIGARGGSKIFRELFREYYRDVLFPFIKDNNIKTVIHAGDFFDNRSMISLHDIDYVVNEFIPQFEQTGATMHVIAGNHDVAYKNTNAINSLSILKQSDSIGVIDNEIEIVVTGGDKSFVLCPWINKENHDDLMEELQFYANDDHILVGHFEIEGAKMYKNSKVCDHGLKSDSLKGFHKVLSGHFHHPSKYGNIEYLGALFHYNWMDYNDWRGYQVYHPMTNEFEKFENPYCLFTQLDYHNDLVNIKQTDYADWFSGQFVRIIINDEYKRVELKDIVHSIEKQQPISVDIIDNTIITDKVSDVDFDDIEDEDVENKDISKYAEEYFKGMDNESELNELFVDIEKEARNDMVEFE